MKATVLFFFHHLTLRCLKVNQGSQIGKLGWGVCGWVAGDCRIKCKSVAYTGALIYWFHLHICGFGLVLSNIL